MGETQPAWPAGTSEMAERIRTFDWASTPLGPLSAWPLPLRTLVDVVLASPQPMSLAWGPELTVLYGDASAPVLTNRHPGALGRPWWEVWAEIADADQLVLDALLRGEPQTFDAPVAFAGGPDCPVRWFSFSATPVRDEVGRVAGVLTVTTDTTAADLRLLVDRVPALLAYLDRDLCFRLANAAVCRYYGTTEAELRGRPVAAVVGPAVYARLRPWLEAALGGAEVRFDDPDPDWYGPGLAGVTEEHYIPRFGPDGAVVGLFCLSVDVTAQRRGEAALRESEARYRATLAALPDLLFLIAPDGTYIDYHAGNPARLLVPPEAFLGKTAAEVLPPPVAAQVVPAVARVARTGEPTSEPYALTVDGEERSFEARLVRTEDGNVLSIVRDVTDRVRAEAALRETEARYRAVVDSQTELICRCLPDTTLTFVNDAYCRAVGTTREDLLGCRILDLVADPGRTLFAAFMSALVADPRTAELDYEFDLPDGTAVCQHWVNHPIFNAEGNLIEFQGIGRDVTELRRVEACLRASEAQLRLALENAAMGTWDWQVDAGLVAWSAHAGPLFGLPDGTPVSSIQLIDAVVHPDDRERICEIAR